jgi:hypothetical protein
MPIPLSVKVQPDGQGGITRPSVPTTQPIRVAFYAARGAAEPTLVLNFRAGWRATAGPLAELRITGSLDSPVLRGSVPCDVTVVAAGATLRLRFLAVGQHRVVQSEVDFSALETTQAPPVRVGVLTDSVGEIAVTNEFIMARHMGAGSVGRDLVRATDGAVQVSFGRIPQHRQPNSGRGPLGVTFARNVRFAPSIAGAVNGYDLSLFWAGETSDGRGILLHRWRTGSAGSGETGYPFVLADFDYMPARAAGTASLAVPSRGVALVGVRGWGVLEFWNRRVVEPFYASMTDVHCPYTTLPVVESASPHGGEWSVVLGEVGDRTWRPLATGPGKGVRLTLDARRFRGHNGRTLKVDVESAPGWFATTDAPGAGPGNPDAVRVLAGVREALGDGDQLSLTAASTLRVAPPPVAGAPTVGACAPADAAARFRMRLGALDVEFEPQRCPGDTDPDAGTVRLRAMGADAAFLIGGLQRLDVELVFRASAVTPGGQDVDGIPTAADEIDSLFQLEPALIIPVRSRQPLPRELTVRLREGTVPAECGWPLAVELHRKRGETSRGGDTLSERVVVLDRQPLLVAMVEYPFFLAGATISDTTQTMVARWNSQTRRWDYRSESAQARLRLPAQAVGEEMERERALTGRESAPLDYRIGKPARVRLAMGDDAPRYFRQAPWNIERLFSDPDPRRSDEAVVDQIQVELLYGLTCEVDRRSDEVLRVADITRRMGGIPGPLPGRLPWQNVTPAQHDAYQEARRDWARLFRMYQSRLMLLEPFPDAQRYSLSPAVLRNPSVTCTVAHPDSVDAHPPVGAEWDGRRLRGGALWAIENVPVYNDILRHAAASDSALLSDFGMTSLGGYGHVESSFGNTRILATVQMGRVSEYSVERRGRIGVFWNRAKHVVVYQRTTYPTEQFKDHQFPFVDRAVVRKVSEYIEIEQPTRRYPEDGGSRRDVGPVAACVFPPGTRISVRSAWGSEVGDVGWKVPLWNHAAAAAQPGVYPKPAIDLLMVRGGRTPAAVGGEAVADDASAYLPCPLEEPENVYFFTWTRDGGGTAPDEWPAVEGVDYVEARAPAAPRTPGNLRRPGDVDAAIPDPSLVPVGFAPVSFRVRSGDQTVNVRAGLDGSSSMNACLDSVTLSREPSAQELPSLSPIAQTLEGLPARLEGAAAAIRELLERATTPAEIAALRDRVVMSGGANSIAAVAALADDAAAVRVQLDTTLAGVTAARVTALHDSLVARLTAEKGVLRRELDSIRSNAEETAREVARVVRESGVEAARRHVEDLSRRWTEALARQQALSEPLLQAVIGVASGARSLRAAWPQDLAELETILNRRGTQTELLRWVHEREARVDAWIRQVSAGRAEWIVAASSAAAQLVGPLRQGLTDLRREIQTGAAADTIVARARGLEGRWDQAARAWLEAMCPGAGLSLLPGVEQQILQCGVIPKRLAAAARRVRDVVRSGLSQQQIEVAVRDALARELPRLDAAEMVRLRADLNRRATELQNALKAQHELGKAVLAGGVADVRELFDTYFPKVDGDIQQAKAMVRVALERWQDEVARSVGPLGAAVERNLRPLPAMLDQVRTRGERSLRLLRAVGSPPEVSDLEFTRERLGYFYARGADEIGLTPALARVSRLGNEVRALGLDLPVEKLRDKLVPPSLANFDLNTIFSDFAGLKLGSLFSGLRLPPGAEERIEVRHGADGRTGRFWMDVRVNRFPIARQATLFTIGPVELLLDSDPMFEATARIASTLGGPQERTVEGSITGKWSLRVGGTPVMSFVDTALRFESPNRLKFAVRPERIELNQALQFFSDLLSSASGTGGFNLSIKPSGIESILDMAMNPIAAGTFAISNLRVGARFGVYFGDGFAIEAGAFLGRRDAPFAITIFVLGGGGYVDVRTRYAVSTGRMSSAVSIGISAVASVGVALGPIRGGVFVSLGFAVDFVAGERDNRGLRIAVVFVLSGEVSVLGIVDVNLTLYLEAAYDSNSRVIQGTGRVKLKIKICWCFTLKVSRQISYRLGCDSEHVAMLAPRISDGDLAHLATNSLHLLA